MNAKEETKKDVLNELFSDDSKSPVSAEVWNNLIRYIGKLGKNIKANEERTVKIENYNLREQKNQEKVFGFWEKKFDERLILIERLKSENKRIIEQSNKSKDLLLDKIVALADAEVNKIKNSPANYNEEEIDESTACVLILKEEILKLKKETKEGSTHE